MRRESKLELFVPPMEGTPRPTTSPAGVTRALSPRADRVGPKTSGSDATRQEMTVAHNDRSAGAQDEDADGDDGDQNCLSRWIRVLRIGNCDDPLNV